MKNNKKYLKNAMKKFISLFVAGLMSLSLVACGSSSDNTYVYSSELDIKNLDSSDADDGCYFTAMHAIIDGLMTLDVDGNVVYGIAEDSSVSEDGLTHTYVMKKYMKMMLI